MTDKCDWLPCWEQIIPASSPWLQLWMPIPLWGQTSRAVSFPLQPNSSRKIGPVPRPKFDPIIPFIKLLWVVAIASASWANKQASLYVCMYGNKHVHHIKTMLITWLTTCRYSKLSAHHHCISVIPSIITHCTPTSSLADLHPSFIFISATHQSHIRVVTNWDWGETNVSNNRSWDNVQKP